MDEPKDKINNSPKDNPEDFKIKPVDESVPLKEDEVIANVHYSPPGIQAIFNFKLFAKIKPKLWKEPIGGALARYDQVHQKHQEQIKLPFKSRFGFWFKSIAMAIVIIFTCEQASWAFNYNPSIIWGDKAQAVTTEDPETDGQSYNLVPQDKADAITSERISLSVSNLLNQIANKPHTQIQLQLTNPTAQDLDSNPSNNYKKLLIDSDTFFTTRKIDEYTRWLRRPEIHPLNCGVWALRDILASKDINVQLEELSVSSLMVDIMSDIIRPGDPSLKTSLYSISRIVDAYDLDFKAASLDPKDVPKLQTPFIANFSDEHFVTVVAVNEGQVYYTDIGRSASATIDEFTSQLTGYVLAPNLEAQKDLKFEYVPESVQAFVWGSAWLSQADQLPGFVTLGEQLTGIGIQIAIIFATWGLGNFISSLQTGTSTATTAVAAVDSASKISTAIQVFASKLSLAMGASNFARTLAALCVIKEACSNTQAMILNIAISAAVTSGFSFATSASIMKDAAINHAADSANVAVGELSSKVMDQINQAFNITLKGVVGAIAKGVGAGVARGLIQIEVAKVLDKILDKVLGDAADDVVKQQIVGFVSGLAANAAMQGGMFGLKQLGLDIDLSNSLDPSKRMNAEANAQSPQSASLTSDVVGSPVPFATTFGSLMMGVLNNSNYKAQLIGIGVQLALTSIFSEDSKVGALLGGDSLISGVIVNVVTQGILGGGESGERFDLRNTLIALSVAIGAEILENNLIDGDRAGINQGERVKLLGLRAGVMAIAGLFEGVTAVFTSDFESDKATACEGEGNCNIEDPSKMGIIGGILFDMAQGLILAVEPGLSTIDRDAVEARFLAGEEYDASLLFFNDLDEFASMSGFTIQDIIQLNRTENQIRDDIREEMMEEAKEQAIAEGKGEEIVNLKISKSKLESRVHEQFVVAVYNQINPLSTKYFIDSLNSVLSSSFTSISADANPFLRGADYIGGDRNLRLLVTDPLGENTEKKVYVLSQYLLIDKYGDKQLTMDLIGAGVKGKRKVSVIQYKDEEGNKIAPTTLIADFSGMDLGTEGDVAVESEDETGETLLVSLLDEKLDKDVYKLTGKGTLRGLLNMNQLSGYAQEGEAENLVFNATVEREEGIFDISYNEDDDGTFSASSFFFNVETGGGFNRTIAGRTILRELQGFTFSDSLAAAVRLTTFNILSSELQEEVSLFSFNLNNVNRNDEDDEDDEDNEELNDEDAFFATNSFKGDTYINSFSNSVYIGSPNNITREVFFQKTSIRGFGSMQFFENPVRITIAKEGFSTFNNQNSDISDVTAALQTDVIDKSKDFDAENLGAKIKEADVLAIVIRTGFSKNCIDPKPRIEVFWKNTSLVILFGLPM